MVVFAAVVNTYRYVGKEFEDFCAVIDEKSRGKNRGRTLIQLYRCLELMRTQKKCF